MRWELVFLLLVALVFVKLELGLVFFHVEETLKVTQCIISFFFRNISSSNSSFASNNATSVIQQRSSRLIFAMVFLADVITSIIQMLELFNEKSNSVFYQLLWDYLVAVLVGTNVTCFAHRFFLLMNDLWEVISLITEWANYLQRCNGSFLQLACCFRLHDWICDVCHTIILFIGPISLVELVLFAIHTQALSNEIYFYSFNMLNQPSDWRQKLLSNIPININHKILPLIQELFWTVCRITNQELLSFDCFGLANDIRDIILNQV